MKKIEAVLMIDETTTLDEDDLEVLAEIERIRTSPPNNPKKEEKRVNKYIKRKTLFNRLKKPIF